MTVTAAKIEGMPKTIDLYMKHNDCIALTIENDQGGESLDMYNEYLPRLGVLGGDETQLRIDNATGKIIGWKPITNDELHKFISDAGMFDE